MKFRFSESFTVGSEEDPWRTEGLRTGFFGAPGSGKSYCAAVFVEQFLDQGGTVVIFQPRAEWHTLKEHYGQVQVVGGPFNQDVPFIASEPKLYADAVVNQGISMVFYTGDIEDEGKLISFCSSFIIHLLRFEETVKRPILLVLEETQEYAPRSSQGHIAPPWVYNRMIKQFKDCFTQGRKLNVSPIAISQRPQEVNYTIRQLCNLTLYGKFAPQDINYIDKECLKPYRDKGLEVKANQLLDLVAGQWLVISGSRGGVISFTAKRKTPHGADTPRLEYVAPPSREVEKTITDLGKQLQAMLEKREAEKSELEKARRRIRVLETGLEDLKKKADIAGVLREGFKNGMEKGVLKGQRKGDLQALEKEVERLGGELKERDERVLRLIKSEERLEEIKKIIETPDQSRAGELGVKDHDVLASAVSGIVKNLPVYERKIYEHLSKHQGIAFTRYQIATANGIGVKSSRYGIALRRLKSLKLIEEAKEGFTAGKI